MVHGTRYCVEIYFWLVVGKAAIYFFGESDVLSLETLAVSMHVVVLRQTSKLDGRIKNQLRVC